MSENTFSSRLFSITNGILNYIKEKWYIFIIPFLISLICGLLMWNGNIGKFFYSFTFLLFIELIVCEPSIKKSNFFRIHKSYYQTFYFIIFIVSLLNITLSYYIGFQFISIFLGVSLITVLLGKKAGQSSSIFFSALMPLLFPSHVGYTILVILAGYLTAYMVQDVNRRIEFTAIALIISFFKFTGFLVLMFAGAEKLSVANLIYISITPLLSTILIIGMLPYIEWISRIYSNIGMLELGNLNHPLLKKLMQTAPGTYYHSFMLSNLCESAAEKIGVNPILVRTGSYFHDIGKSKKPEFFTENQNNENPHDFISPSMSHLILMEHVKYGVELARQYRLPILFEDLIIQHHGTRVQKYFYHKAKTESEGISEDQYRYTGPKPLFKEAGILMLADSCEAAVKSIKNPSPQKISEMISDIVNKIYLERELDDSGLTLKELELIIQEFTRVIVKFSHKRIEYPKEENNAHFLGDNYGKK